MTEVFFPIFSFCGGVETTGEAEGERERLDSRYDIALQEGEKELMKIGDLLECLELTISC